MSRNKFVDPSVHRLELSDGDWVEVKQRLGVAEDQRVKSALFRGVHAANFQKGGVAPKDVELRVDTSMVTMAKLHSYIVDWNFVDHRGKPVKVSASAIDNLDPDVAEEILDKLNEFLTEQEAVRKDDPFTRPNSEAQ